MPPKSFAVEAADPSLITEGVPPGQQTMSADKSFWIFFTPGFTVSTWLLGVLIAQNLGFWPATIAVILGNVIAVIPVAILAGMGPKLRLTQIEGTRYALGRYGVRLPGFLNWFASIGWDAVNNVPAAGALVALALLAKWSVPFWAMLAVLVVIQTVIAIFGHHVTQSMAKYLGFIMPVLFIGLGLRALAVDGHTVMQTVAFNWKAFALSLGLVVTGATSWLAYAADYTRYLPPTTSPRKLFARVYLGIGLSLGLMQFFGVVSSTGMPDTSTAGIIAALQNLAGPLAPLVLVMVAVSSIPANAINDNSAAYCLVTAGIRVMRPLSVTIGAVIGFVLTLYGAAHILPLIVNVMMLMLYWLMAWGGIAVVQALDPQATSRKPSAWPAGATIFVAVTLVCTLLFADNELYVGPVAAKLGGLDIGYYIAFAAAALLYRWSLPYGKLSRDPIKTT
jgi:NCS1 family nucleobase:cation symporter-1